jgi:hypothetical protein
MDARLAKIAEAEQWPVRIACKFAVNMTVAAANDFANWIENQEAPGPCLRRTHFVDMTLTVAFPTDVETRVIDWWLRFLRAQGIVLTEVSQV